MLPSGKNDIGAVYASVFVAFTIVLFICMGYMPDWYALQVVYYSFCMILFATGLVYATSAVTVFFSRHERSGGNPVADRHVGDADYVEL